MRRTSAAALIAVAAIGGAVAWLLQTGLAAGGVASFTAPPTLWSVLFVVAIGLLVLGRPVRRTVRGRALRRVDPFFAMRVLVLAKASSLAGALLAGSGALLVLYAVVRTGSIGTAGFWPAVLLTAGAVALGVAGLVVEWWCRIPPEDRAEERQRVQERR